MSHVNKSNVKRPISPYAPYLKFVKNGNTVFKTQNELTEDDKKLLPPLPPAQDGATKEQLAEYNALAKKYNSILQQDNIRIRMSDVDRLEYLHGLMSEQQRANAEPFPDFPEPPPPPEEPQAPEEIEEEMMEVEREMANQEKAMERREAEMEKKEMAMIEQEQAIEKREIEMERLGRYSHFPAPPNLPYRVDQKPLTKELKNLVDDFGKKRRLYQNAMKDYLNNGRGNENKIYGMYESLMEAYDQYKVMATDEGVFAHPVPAHAPKVQKGEKSSIPPPPPRPPAPESPLKHVRQMADKNADFYFDGKKISSEKAIEIVENNKDINIQIRDSNIERPLVRLSTDPIQLSEN